MLVVAAAAGWLLLRDDGADPSGLGALDALPAVASAARQDDRVVVTLRPDADREAVRAVLAALPDDDRSVLRLGRATLQLDDRVATASSSGIAPFVAAAGVRAAGGRVVLARRSTGWSVTSTVPRTAQAAPLAREIVRRIAPQGRYVADLDRLEVALAGAPQSDVPPVVLRRLAGSDRRVAMATLDAAVRLAAREPRVSTAGDTAELGVRAAGVADAGPAWRAAGRALRLEQDRRGGVRLDVDTPAGPPETRGRPVLSGPADAAPDRALAVLRRLAGPATHAFASTNLRTVEADVPGPRGARAAAAAVQGAAKRLRVRWPADGAPGTPVPGSTDVEPAHTDVLDAPATVLRLLPGIARARKAGIRQVAWDRPPALDLPRLRIAPPSWADTTAPLPRDPATLRRLARAVRAVDWPGTARFDLPLGPSGCASYPQAQAGARIVSTARGRARSVRVQAPCALDGAERAVRRAWAASAR